MTDGLFIKGISVANLSMTPDGLHVLLFVTLGVATLTDWTSARIPNWLTFPAMGLGLFSHTLMDGSDGFLFSAQGLGLGFGLFLIVYLFGGMGAGDVKLVAAVGSLIGPSELLSALFMTALLGGLFAGGIMLAQRGWRENARWLSAQVKTLLLTGRIPAASADSCPRLSLRYGPVIAVGTLISQLAHQSLLAV